MKTISKAQVIEKYKEKYSVDIVHPCKLTTHELQMLDFCIDHFASELTEKESEVRTAEEQYSKNDIDLAYLTGVFNTSGIDATGKEIERLKKIGKEPHDIFSKRNKELSQFQQPEITDEDILKSARQYKNHMIDTNDMINDYFNGAIAMRDGLIPSKK